MSNSGDDQPGLDDTVKEVQTPSIEEARVSQALNEIIKNMAQFAPILPTEPLFRTEEKDRPDWQAEMEQKWRKFSPARMKESRRAQLVQLSKAAIAAATPYAAWKENPENFDEEVLNFHLKHMSKAMVRYYASHAYYMMLLWHAKAYPLIDLQKDYPLKEDIFLKFIQAYDILYELRILNDQQKDLTGYFRKETFPKQPTKTASATTSREHSVGRDERNPLTITDEDLALIQQVKEIQRKSGVTSTGKMDPKLLKEALETAFEENLEPIEKVDPRFSRTLSSGNLTTVKTTRSPTPRRTVWFGARPEAPAENDSLEEVLELPEGTLACSGSSARPESGGMSLGSFPDPRAVALPYSMGSFRMDLYIPKPFDGEPSKWMDFYSGLQQATLQMDAMRFPKTMMFTHLKKVVTGSARFYIDKLDPQSEASFTSAVKLLKENFGEGQSELMRIMQSLQKFAPCKDTHEGRQQFHASIVQHGMRVNLIKNCSPEHALFAAHLAVWEQKMPNRMRDYWYRYKNKRKQRSHPLGADIEFPDLSECLRDYIQEEFDKSAAQQEYHQENPKKKLFNFDRRRSNTSNSAQRQAQPAPEAGKTKPSPSGGKPAEPSPPSKESQAAYNADGKVIVVPCTFCMKAKGKQEFPHPFPLQCPKLKGSNALSEQKVQDIALKERLCFLCLGKKCTAAKCPSSNRIKCTICKVNTHCRYLHYFVTKEDRPPPYPSA